MTIEWTEPALRYLEGIRAYIRRDSNYYAERFIERITAILRLRVHSFRSSSFLLPDF
jgi:plasmid stabilization system protein ParE